MLAVKTKPDEPVRAPTSLYTKVFIDGFSRPSCIVLSAHLSGRLPDALAIQTFESLVSAHPSLRSRVERSIFGSPSHLRRHTTAAWRAAGSITVRDPFDLAGLGAFERELLSTPLDPERESLFHVWILHGEEGGRPVSVVVIKAHHAIVDAHAGKRLLIDFMALWRAALTRDGGNAPVDVAETAAKKRAEPAPLPLLQEAAARARRGWEWLRSADLSGRVPDVSLLASYRPRGPLSELPVTFRERVLPIAVFEQVRSAAARRDLTFAHALCSSLLRAMHRYNQVEVERAPARALPGTVGLMIAVTRRWQAGAAGAVGFEADTRLLSVPSPLFAEARAAELDALVKEGLLPRRGDHNDVSLALLYATRRAERLVARLRGGPRPLDPVDGVHFTLSDLTGGALRLRGLIELPLADSAPLRVEALRTLVSPFAPAHAGLIATVYGGSLRLTTLYHEGAVRGDDLLDGLVAELAKRSSEMP